MIAVVAPMVFVEDIDRDQPIGPLRWYETEVDVPPRLPPRPVPIRGMRLVAVLDPMERVVRADETQPAEGVDNGRMPLADCTGTVQAGSNVQISHHDSRTGAEQRTVGIQRAHHVPGVVPMVRPDPQ